MVFQFLQLDEKMRPWAEHHMKLIWMADTTGIVLIDERMRPSAACVMDTWTPNSCNLHIYIENPLVLRRGFLEEVFWFIFERNRRKMVWGFTPSDNEKALKFIEHVGMEEQYRMVDAHADGVDYVVTRMLKEDCRWLRKDRMVA